MGLRWDLFCRVIDNYGDMGVCWRLAKDLQSRGHHVRLWTDEPGILDWMAPAPRAVEVIHWRDDGPPLEPGDVALEAFGCEPPAPFLQRMAHQRHAPVWINLEYLSAEPYVQRSHGLPSPRLHEPGKGLQKWFFFPGFTPGTGGLLREEGLLSMLAAHDRGAWLSAHGVDWRPGEPVVSLFAYPGAPLESWLESSLESWPPAGRRWLLVAQGPLQARAQEWLQAHPRSPWQVVALPWLTQGDFDGLLASCDLNIVRGEDSLVRAIWAGAPFIWHLYPQEDGAHEAKMEALLDALLGAAGPADRAEVEAPLRQMWRRWNRLSGPDVQEWPWGALAVDRHSAWFRTVQAWRRELAAQESLAEALTRFVAQKRASG